MILHVSIHSFKQAKCYHTCSTFHFRPVEIHGIIIVHVKREWSKSRRISTMCEHDM